jgi:hypothetical protein
MNLLTQRLQKLQATMVRERRESIATVKNNLKIKE